MASGDLDQLCLAAGMASRDQEIGVADEEVIQIKQNNPR